MKKFAISPSMETDRFINSAVRNHLRVNRDKVDLPALTIQRGRDHEISGYIKYKNFCSKDILRRRRRKIFPSVNKINNFYDLLQNWNLKMKFQELYNHVQDIDLFTGGLLENPIEGSILGPTFHGILGEYIK